MTIRTTTTSPTPVGAFDLARRGGGDAKITASNIEGNGCDS